MLLGSESVKQTCHLRAVAWQASSLQLVEVNATLLVLMVKRLGLGQYFDLISRIQAFWSLLQDILLFIYICSPYCCFLKLPYPVSPYRYRRVRLAVSVLRRAAPNKMLLELALSFIWSHNSCNVLKIDLPGVFSF